MTENEKEQYIRQVVGHFAAEFWRNRSWQLGQMLPAAQTALAPPAINVPSDDAWLSYGMEPQEWLTMARAGAGLVPATDENRAYVREICQGLAEWLFAVPGTYTYHISADWYATDMGALWAAAERWTAGDELITLAEAAALTGIPLKTLTSRADRGTLRVYVDPLAPARQGKRLVSRRAVLAD